MIAAWKIFVDYGLLLVVLVLGIIGVCFLKSISTQLKILNKFLVEITKKQDSKIPSFLRKN